MGRIGIIFILLFSGHFLMSQNFLAWKYNDRYFSAQVGAGMSMYRGELKHNYQFQNEFSNFSLGMEARLLSKIAVRAEFVYFNIRGKDFFADDGSYEKQRNLSFESRNFEFSIQTIFYLLEYKGDYYKRSQIDPYLFVGLGAVTVNPTTTLAGTKYYLRELETESNSYSPVTMTFPVGMGLKFKLTPFLNFVTEASYRLTLSDYLDDVSTNFPVEIDNTTVALLSNRKDEIALVNQNAYDNILIPGGQRGNSSNKDGYIFLTFKFELFIPPLNSKGMGLKKTSTR
ncbi:MAG: DUF6089 family protein [Cyclobacteriaceae bacterium]